MPLDSPARQGLSAKARTFRQFDLCWIHDHRSVLMTESHQDRAGPSGNGPSSSPFDLSRISFAEDLT
jgi:hypothetical protein